MLELAALCVMPTGCLDTPLIPTTVYKSTIIWKSFLHLLLLILTPITSANSARGTRAVAKNTHEHYFA
jgi:hypothetical protein